MCGAEHTWLRAGGSLAHIVLHPSRVHACLVACTSPLHAHTMHALPCVACTLQHDRLVHVPLGAAEPDALMCETMLKQHVRCARGRLQARCCARHAPPMAAHCWVPGGPCCCPPGAAARWVLPCGPHAATVTRGPPRVRASHTLCAFRACVRRLLEEVGTDGEDLAIVRYKLGTFYYVQVRAWRYFALWVRV